MAVDIQDIRECWADDMAADRRNREEQLLDLRMVADDQWDNEIGRARSDELPKVTINFLRTLANAVIADFRMEKRGVRYEPVDNGADVDLAEIRNGLYRSIHRLSHGDHVLSNAFAGMVIGGIGHFRITHDYPDAEGFDQEIFLEPIYNPLSVVWDHQAIHITRKDARHCFVHTVMNKKNFDGFKKREGLSDFDFDYLTTGEPEFTSAKGVRLAEFFRKTEEQIEIGLTESGQVINLKDFTRDQIGLLGVGQTRKAKQNKVEQYIVAGREIVKGPEAWPTPDIPIVSMVGFETFVGEEIVRSGVIRGAREIQILRNLFRSYGVEMFAKMAKEPGVASAKSIEGFEEHWKGFRIYNEEGEKPDVNVNAAAFAQTIREVERIDEEFRNVTGVMEAKLGQKSNEQSGKAINARVEQTDALNAIFMDNAAVAITHAGKIINDLIPHIYVGERVARIVGLDDTQQTVVINKEITVGGESVMVNDMSVGRYDVFPSVGPSYASQRQESREVLIELMRSVPSVAQAAPDLIVDSLDLPNKEQLVERLRRTLPPQLLGDEDRDPAAEQQAAQTAQLGMRQTQAKVAKDVADAKKAEAEAARAVIAARFPALEGGQPSIGVQNGR